MPMKSIAVVVYSLTIEYNLTVVNGIRHFFQDKKDVNLIIVPVKSPHSKDYHYDYQYWGAIELLRSKSFDAIIVVTNSFLNLCTIDQLSKYLECLLPTPIISVATPLNLPDSKYTCSSCENAYLNIVEHLTKKHNRKKIAFFSAELTHSPESQIRVDAYKAALEANGLEYDEKLVYPGDYTPKTCYEYLKKNFQTKDDLPFDTILCANDYMAAGCISALNEIGALIPEDVCIFGFDDSEVAVNCKPALSTVNQHISEMGFKAGEVAYKVVNNEEVAEKNEIDAFVLYRQSCGCIDKTHKVEGYITQDGAYVGNQAEKTTMDMFGTGLNDMEIIYNNLNMTDSITNINNFCENLKDILTSLRIPLFSLCVYDQPIYLEAEEDFKLPEQARLLIQVNAEEGIFNNYFQQDGLAFNIKENILPASVKIPDSGLYYLTPIFLEQVIYGYLICKLPTPRYPLYCVFFKILSNAFVHAYDFSKKEQERAKLVEKNQNLNFEAKTDELTQLFNRRGFLEYGQQLIDVSVVSNQKGSIFFCDLDGLKKINDTWGHEIGDLAIKTEAKVLRAAFRDSDMIGRLSGDEFAAVAPGFPTDRIEVMRERLTLLNEELSKEAKLPFTLSISIGAVEFDAENDRLKELLTNADKKLYEEKKIKHSGKN